MITCQTVEDKRNIIEYCYSQESEQWHKEVHKGGGNCEFNVQVMVDTISPHSTMYEVLMGEETAGFFVKYIDERAQALEGFHIIKKFRTKDFIISFWHLVKDVFRSDIYIGIYEKNEAAFRHLEKQGFVQINEVVDIGKKYIILGLKI